MDPTVVPLREHLSQRIYDLRDYVDTRFTEIEKSTDLARNSMSTRLDSMNEFRAALKDANATMISRIEVLGMISRLQADINELNKSRWTLAGMASQRSVNIATVIAIVSLALAILKFFVE